MIYLLQRDYEGNPVGVWNEAKESHYGNPDHPLKSVAEFLMETRFEGEPWDEFADRIDDRVSHRDWWEIHESDSSSLEDVWYEIVPSDAPLDV